MSLLNETKLICKQQDIIPTRSKGQNFLINKFVYNKIIEVADINNQDTILEVGPGLGILTRLLSKKAKKIIAVELDDKIYNYLKIAKELEQIDNLKLINDNILDFDYKELKKEKFKIVANLPYNITSVFLRKFLSYENKPNSMVLMLQKEVAQRIVAIPGKMSILAISVQFFADAQIIDNVPKNDFWPSPKVDSAIIKIEPKIKYPKINEKDFFRLVKIGFSAKRKKLVNNLANGFHKKATEIIPLIEKLGFDSNVRAQELSVDDWVLILEFLILKPEVNAIISV